MKPGGHSVGLRQWARAQDVVVGGDPEEKGEGGELRMPKRFRAFETRTVPYFRTTLKGHLSFKTPMKSTEASTETASQFNLSLCPVLLPSLSFRRASPNKPLALCLFVSFLFLLWDLLSPTRDSTQAHNSERAES